MGEMIPFRPIDRKDDEAGRQQTLCQFISERTAYSEQMIRVMVETLWPVLFNLSLEDAVFVVATTVDVAAATGDSPVAFAETVMRAAGGERPSIGAALGEVAKLAPIKPTKRLT